MTPAPLIAEIQAATSAAFGISPVEMRSVTRCRVVARPRQVAMFLSHRWTGHSQTQIGRRFGGRHHTTVMHAIRQVTERLAIDPNLRQIVAGIEHQANQQATTRASASEPRND